MRYSKAEVKDGRIIETYAKVIDQSTLTSDCWLIQFEGLTACERCEIKDTEECGGGDTLKKLVVNSN